MGPQPSRWASDEAALPPSLTAHGRPQPLDDSTAVTNSVPAIASLPALFDNDSDSETVLPAASTTIDWHYAQPRRVAMLTLTSAANAGAPSDWQLQASADGEHWLTLDTRRYQRFAWPRQTRAFAVQAPGEYAYYRLRFDTAEAARALAEIELLGNP
jgi:hypothetical protein